MTDLKKYQSNHHHTKNRLAFTMIELVFVIVVIGILAAIAVPKFAATRDDATITKAMATIGSVRSALATERQKRILRGDFTKIYRLTDSNGAGDAIFDAFDILNKIDIEEENINLSNNTDSKVETKQGFAERRSR